MKRTIKLKESELKRMISESVRRVLKESLTDDDAFMYNYRDAMSDYYDNDPRDDYSPGKKGDNEYSWDEFAYQNANTPLIKQYRQKTMNDMQFNRNLKKYWNKKDNERGRKIMKNWVNGKRSLDDLEDAKFDINASIRGLRK